MSVEMNLWLFLFLTVTPAFVWVGAASVVVWYEYHTRKYERFVKEVASATYEYRRAVDAYFYTTAPTPEDSAEALYDLVNAQEVLDRLLR